MSLPLLKKIEVRKLMDRLIVPPGKKISLEKHYDPTYRIPEMDKQEAMQRLDARTQLLAELQDKLYAQNRYAVLVIFQAMDAAGKDGTIKHVMSGLNPQGCRVYSFKAPSDEELQHDYLWRCAIRVPERGHIGIFNRSYYEEVLIVRVHPEVLEKQRLPPETLRKDIWKRRFEEINNFEWYLSNNGVVVLKFFLYISKQEQKQRFLERIERSDKNWKFSVQDAHERQYWNEYTRCYEDCLNHTSTKWAPWYVIPADHKPSARLSVAIVLHEAMKKLKPDYPTVSERQRMQLLQARDMLMAEKE
jgi:PPK2 family polyphosphate:nucleotide phosphotransferase